MAANNKAAKNSWRWYHYMTLAAIAAGEIGYLIFSREQDISAYKNWILRYSTKDTFNKMSSILQNIALALATNEVLVNIGMSSDVPSLITKAQKKLNDAKQSKHSYPALTAVNGVLLTTVLFFGSISALVGLIETEKKEWYWYGLGALLSVCQGALFVVGYGWSAIEGPSLISEFIRKPNKIQAITQAKGSKTNAYWFMFSSVAGLIYRGFVYYGVGKSFSETFVSKSPSVSLTFAMVSAISGAWLNLVTNVMVSYTAKQQSAKETQVTGIGYQALRMLFIGMSVFFTINKLATLHGLVAGKLDDPHHEFTEFKQIFSTTATVLGIGGIMQGAFYKYKQMHDIAKKLGKPISAAKRLLTTTSTSTNDDDGSGSSKTASPTGDPEQGDTGYGSTMSMGGN